MNSDQLLKLAIQATEDKKAEDIISIDMRGISDMTDYFVVCHGNNDRQVQDCSFARSGCPDREHRDIDIPINARL